MIQLKLVAHGVNIVNYLGNLAGGRLGCRSVVCWSGYQYLGNLAGIVGIFHFASLILLVEFFLDLFC
jgi:hypothetical protein